MRRRTMRSKLLFLSLLTSVFVLLTNLLIYDNVNRKIDEINRIYKSNVNLNEVSGHLDQLQSSIYQYLNTKSSSSLEAYYKAAQEYEQLCQNLNQNISDQPILLMEKNLREISGTYLNVAEETILAKRGRNVERYKQKYQEAQNLYTYMEDYLASLNNLQFKYNANEYLLLQHSLQVLEVLNITIMLVLIGVTTVTMFLITRQITKPLAKLAGQAGELAAGNFDIDLLEVHTGDEVETLSRAFNTMVISIRDYITRLRESMEQESLLKEQGLIMENHLKDAQLKYLYAQINPHFLFNTLNAGVQMAMMENAEKTSVYIENVAEFFRYNITDINQDTTIAEEIALVDYYVHILNARFSDEIIYEKDLDPRVLDIRMPRMILQPLVENAFQYGIRDKEGTGKIQLRAKLMTDTVLLSVEDNGKGMSADRIHEILNGTSNGVGLTNVIGRLELYYSQKDVLTIDSAADQGTQIIIRIPLGQIPPGNQGKTKETGRM